MSTAKVIVGVLAGVAVGAAIGILFSPDKGTNTRKKITRKSENMMHDIEDGLSDIYDTISKKYGQATEEVERAMKSGKAKLNKAAEKLEHETK
jgi:gas vesicle protein